MPRLLHRSRRTPSAVIIARTLILLTIATPAAAQQGEPAIVREARDFMRAYAQDLAAGNRSAVSGRYDRTGSYRMGDGEKVFVPYDSIVALYAGPRWAPPRSFGWQDIDYEALGSDAVVVVGTGLWEYAKDKPPIAISYTALLRRQDGTLRIRVEHESTGAPPGGKK